MFDTIGVCVLIASLVAPVAAISGGNDDPWIVDGLLSSVLPIGDQRLLFAGDFDRAGPLTGPMVHVEGGKVLHAFPEITGPIHVIKSDGQGNYYVGGEFVVSTNGDLRNLVKVDSEGKIDPSWTPSPDGVVKTIEINDAGIFIGGHFKELFGAQRAGVAKLSMDGRLEQWQVMDGKLREWHVDLSRVNKIVSDEKYVYLAGAFQIFGSSTYRMYSDGILGVAKNNPNDTWQTGFRGAPHILDMEIHNGALYFSGRFDHVSSAWGDLPRQGFAAIDLDSKKLLDIDLKLSDQGQVHNFELFEDRIYLAGNFSSVNGIQRDRLVEVDFNGNVTEWMPPVLTGSRSAPHLQIIGDELFVLGEFESHSSYLGGLRAYSVDTAVPKAPVIIDGAVKGIAFTEDGTMIVGGEFTKAGGEERRYLVHINTDGSMLDNSADVDGPVTGVWQVNGRTWLAGAFNGANRYWCPGLLVLNKEGGVEDCPDVDGQINDVIEYGSKTVVVGNFTKFQGEPAGGVAVLDHDLATVHLPSEFHGKASHVRVMGAVVQDGELYITAYYAGNPHAAALFRIETDGSLEKLESPPIEIRGLTSRGDSLVLIGTKQLVELDPATGGQKQFPLVNRTSYLYPENTVEYVNGAYVVGSSRAISGSDGHGTLINAAPDSPLGRIRFKDPVYALAQRDDTIWVGGAPTTSEDVPGYSALKVNLRTKAVSSDFGVAPTDRVSAVVKAGDGLIFGGQSTSYLAKHTAPAVITDHRGVVDRNWKLDGDYKEILSAGILQGRVFACARTSSGHAIAGIDVATGKTLWKRNVSLDRPSKCALEVHAGRLYVAGIRKLDQHETALAILDTQGNVIDHDVVDGNISSLGTSQEKLFIVGSFNTFNGSPRPGVALLDSKGELTAWTTNVIKDNGLDVTKVAEFNGMYMVMGSFQKELGDDYLRHVVAIGKDGGKLDWRPDRNLGTATAIARYGDNIIVGGFFDYIWSGKYAGKDTVRTPQYGIAAFDGSGRVAEWNPGVYRKRPSDFHVIGDNLYVAWMAMGRQPERSTRASEVHENVATLGPVSIPKFMAAPVSD